MERGDVARVAYLTDTRPDGVSMGWRPPKGKVYVVCVLGVEDKKVGEESVLLDPEQALREMGWVKQSEEGPQ